MEFKNVLLFLFYFVVALIALFLVIILGERGSWYFSWVLGTMMIVLIGAFGAALLDAQEEHADKSRRDQ